jgi:hypothetical protein
MADPRPRVFLGMPCYGGMTASAANAFYNPTRGDVLVPYARVASNSLTGHCFNVLLSQALDLREAGEIDHFAMIHSDINAGEGWIDELYAEMIAHSLGFVSAVVPIKEDTPDPPTSTAIGDAFDPWAVLHKLHVSSRHAFGETFTAETACAPGEVLLVNTGLWLADLRHPAWDAFPGFNITTRIGRDDEGKRVAQMRPEDWELSRHLASHGVRVGATWRVRVGHEGVKTWWNR